MTTSLANIADQKRQILDNIVGTLVREIRAGNPWLKYAVAPRSRSRYCIYIMWDRGPHRGKSERRGGYDWIGAEYFSPGLSGVDDLHITLGWYGIDKTGLTHGDRHYIVDQVMASLGPIASGAGR